MLWQLLTIAPCCDRLMSVSLMDSIPERPLRGEWKTTPCCQRQFQFPLLLQYLSRIVAFPSAFVLATALVAEGMTSHFLYFASFFLTYAGILLGSGVLYLLLGGRVVLNRLKAAVKENNHWPSEKYRAWHPARFGADRKAIRATDHNKPHWTSVAARWVVGLTGCMLLALSILVLSAHVYRAMSGAPIYSRGSVMLITSAFYGLHWLGRLAGILLMMFFGYSMARVIFPRFPRDHAHSHRAHSNNDKKP